VSETLGQVLTYIDTLFPNALTTATKVDLINAEQRKIWEHMTSTNYYDSLTTLSSQALYSLPTNVTIDMVAENGIMISNSTEPVTSTHSWTSYEYAGADEELTGNRFYDGLNGLFGIYPVPSSGGYPIRIRYQEYFTAFASTDTSVQFNLDQDYIDLIKYRVMSRVAKSGKFPNVELANNYEMDAREIERKMKIKQAKDKAKTPKSRWSYKEWK
jgi:hypothetical protein